MYPGLRYGIMRLLYVFLLIIPAKLSAQSLLVNGGFEEENICTEYNVNCAPEGWIYTVPSFNYYFRDAKLAHTGFHFISLIAAHSSREFHRTFVRSRLLCGLRKGKTYSLQFFIKSRHPILDSVGIYFTPYDFLFEKKVYRKIEPSLYLADATGKPIKDTNWQRVTIDYRANGDESFITLGYFAKNDIKGPTGIHLENYFYVLFDDISLIPTDPNESICDDWQQTQDEIYNQSERHEFLDRLVKYNRSKPIKYLKSTPTMVQKIDTAVLPDILFKTGSANLSESSYQFLDSICNLMSKTKVDSIVVEGHTDSIGNFDQNKVLGSERANSVMNYMRARFPNAHFFVRSWSSIKPVADNRTPVGRQKNRRVEIYLYTRE
jgi:outer membrane protein OmpA-like peptidoglycan-associated protein